MQIFDKKNLVYLLFITAAVILLWPFLFDHQIILQKWASDEGYAFNAYFAKHLGDHLPLWFESYNHGFPAYLNQSGGFLHPAIILFFKLTDYFTAYYLLMLFSISVSFIATYVLARNLGMSLKAAVISSFTFTFSQVSIYAHAVTSMGTMLSVIPVLFLCVLKLDRARDRRIKIWLVPAFAAILALGWVAAYVEGIFLATVSCFLFALFLDINFYAANKEKTGLFGSLKTSLAMIWVIFLSGILASPWLLPVINFIKETGRGVAINIDWSSFLSLTWSDVSLMRIVHLFYPYISIPYSEGIPQIATGVIADFTYVGILPLFFGILAFLNYKQNKSSLFFILLFLFTLLTWLPYIPLNWLIHKLPVFSLFEGYWKWIYVMIFNWAMLAGFGFDSIEKNFQTKKFRFVITGFEILLAGVLALAALGNVLLLLFRDKIAVFIQKYFAANYLENIYTARAAGSVDFDYINNLINQTMDVVRWNVSFLNPHFLLAMLFVFVPLILLVLLKRNKMPLGKFKLFSVVLVILTFIFLWRGYYTQASADMVINPPSAVKFLNTMQKEDQFRVVGFPLFARYKLDLRIDSSDVVSRVKANLDLLVPMSNTSLFYDLDSIVGVENYRPVRHVRMLAYTLGGIDVGTRTKLGNEGNGYEMSMEERIKNFNAPFSRNLLSMMNVKYIVTVYRLPKPWKLVFESVEADHEIPVRIYENPNVMPRIYFAKNVIIVSKNTETAFEELKNIEDFRKTTLIECDNPLCYSAIPNNISGKDELRVEKTDFDYLKLKTKTKTPRWLVYSQSNLPTWEVRIDGKLTDIYTANYIYQGIYIPEGEHEVEFRYPGFFGQFYCAIKNLMENPDIVLKYLNRER